MLSRRDHIMSKNKPSLKITLRIMKLKDGYGALPKLLRVRWMGQLTDGAFQSALASFVLFSPERQPDAVKAALAFTVVLLPYSLVGPYAGIFLDRVGLPATEGGTGSGSP